MRQISGGGQPQNMRQSLRDMRAIENARDLNATTGKEFNNLLMRRYGNLVRAWRLGLDRDGSGKLTFLEFCKSARELGFGGNVKALWQELDADGSGSVSLKELCPEVYELLMEFSRAVMAKY